MDAEGVVEYPFPEFSALLEPRPREGWIAAWMRLACVPIEAYRARPRFVPLIDVITGVEDVQRAKEFVAVWRTVRSRWLERVFVTRRAPSFATRDAWKMFARGSFQVQPDYETLLVCIKFANFLGLERVLSLPEDNFCFENDDDPAPLDQKITVKMLRGTVRELTDLNFFFDLLEVEQARTGEDGFEICDRMYPMTAEMPFTSCLDIPRSSLWNRRDWLLAVRDVVANWPMTRSPLGFLANTNPPSLCSVEALEAAVAHVYCTHVTLLLHRQPVLPRY